MRGYSFWYTSKMLKSRHLFSLEPHCWDGELAADVQCEITPTCWDRSLVRLRIPDRPPVAPDSSIRVVTQFEFGAKCLPGKHSTERGCSSTTKSPATDYFKFHYTLRHFDFWSTCMINAPLNKWRRRSLCRHSLSPPFGNNPISYRT